MSFYLTGVTNKSQASRLAVFELYDSSIGFIKHTVDGDSSYQFPFCEVTVGFNRSEVKVGQVLKISDDMISEAGVFQYFRVQNIQLINDGELKLICSAYINGKYDGNRR